MKMFFDLFPVILFFIVYKKWDIYVATTTLMVAFSLQVAGLWIVKRKVEKMYFVSLIAILVFGALTLVLRNPVFIKWKPTIINWIFGAVFLGSSLVGGRPVVKRLMGPVVALSDSGWTKLNGAWILFFITCGLLNLVVAYQCTENTWVNFKLFGLTGLSFAFVVGQALVLRDHLNPAEESSDESK